MNFLKVKGKNIAIFYMLFFFLSVNLFASKLILSSDGMIDKRAMKKIEEIGQEVRIKTGINIYVYVKRSLGLKKDVAIKDKIDFIRLEEQKLVKNLEKPYVVLTMAIKDTHVNLLVSPRLKKIINKDDILDNYVVPIVASKDKNTIFSKVSAAILNGYAQIADIIASNKNISLDSNIGNSGKTAATIWRFFIYIVVIIGLFLYIFAALKQKKK